MELITEVITLTHLHVLSIKAPYVRENPISLNQTLKVQVPKLGVGYITMGCKQSKRRFFLIGF